MRKRIYLFIGLVLGLIVTGWWTYSLAGGDMPYMDQWTRGPVTWVAGTSFYTFFRFVTNFGSEFFMYPFTVIMAILLMIAYRDWFPGVIFAMGTLLGHLVNSWIKTMIARERPSVLAAANAEGFSFPSGHAMVTLIAYGLLMYFIIRKLRSQRSIMAAQIMFIGMILLIGSSRYFINVHYITDILAGFLFGGILLYVLIHVYEWIERRRGQEN